MLRLALLTAMLVACTDTSSDDDDGGDDGGGLSDDGDAGQGTSEDTVELETTLGTLVVELDLDAAPITSENFLGYIDAGFYDGADGLGATTFHRIVPGFVVQGGGYTEEGEAKQTEDPIIIESNNGLSNVRGTIAMARTSDADSATSQFYFNLVDNTGLDYSSISDPGYTVFGALVEGEDVMDAIAETADGEVVIVRAERE